MRRSERVANPLRSVVLRQHFEARVLGGSRISSGTNAERHNWIWVDEWPLTGSGKIQKFKLREAFEAGKPTTTVATAH